MSEETPNYRWPWLLLVVFLFGCLLAVLWLVAEVKRTHRIHELNLPAAFTERAKLQKIDPAAILKAAQLCAADFRKHGESVPALLPLYELVQRGFLRQEAATGFEGMAVFVSLHADALHPQEVLVEVRLPDGRKFVALADGSVQER